MSDPRSTSVNAYAAGVNSYFSLPVSSRSLAPRLVRRSRSAVSLKRPTPLLGASCKTVGSSTSRTRSPGRLKRPLTPLGSREDGNISLAAVTGAVDGLVQGLVGILLTRFFECVGCRLISPVPSDNKVSQYGRELAIGYSLRRVETDVDQRNDSWSFSGFDSVVMATSSCRSSGLYFFNHRIATTSFRSRPPRLC